MAVPRTPALLVLALACAFAPALAQARVTVYRCTDARGKVLLRDSPCPKGQKQNTREMARIVDPPAPPRRAAASVAAPAAPAAAPQYVVVNAPRPMYECVTPDGQTYTSQSPEGNPRWMPLWTLDYPVLAERHVSRPGGARIRYRDRRVAADVRGGGVERPALGSGVVPTIAAYGNAGTWVRDACSALPQQEACARLRDDRDALRRRFFNAQPSERARITVQERGINARLAADCGGR